MMISEFNARLMTRTYTRVQTPEMISGPAVVASLMAANDIPHPAIAPKKPHS